MAREFFSILQWWTHKRIKYNIALLFTGLIGLMLQLVTYFVFNGFSKSAETLLDEVEFSAMLFIAMIITANLAFTLGSIIDILFNYRDNQSFREWLFMMGYWFSIALLSLLVISFLFVIN